MPRLVPAFAAIAFLLSALAPAKAELLVTVSKSQQRLSVVIDGAETYRWPVSTGVRGHETPVGAFRPHDLERHWYSRQYSLTPMPWAVFFHRGYAVHGTMEAYNLGHAASHGCVRLRPDNASILYSLVRRYGMSNTKVVVLQGALPAAPGAVPMADAGTPPADDAVAADQFAKAVDGDEDYFAAKTHRDGSAAQDDNDQDDGKIAAGKPSQNRLTGAVVYRVSVGSDEARILREREAWLRSLDRKYGMTR
jgi:hypothetical protein